MSETLESVRRLVTAGEVRISEHGYDELSDDRIPVKDVLSSIQQAKINEHSQADQVHSRR